MFDCISRCRNAFIDCFSLRARLYFSFVFDPKSKFVRIMKISWLMCRNWARVFWHDLSIGNHIGNQQKSTKFNENQYKKKTWHNLFGPIVFRVAAQCLFLVFPREQDYTFHLFLTRSQNKIASWKFLGWCVATGHFLLAWFINRKSYWKSTKINENQWKSMKINNKINENQWKKCPVATHQPRYFHDADEFWLRVENMWKV